MTPKELARKLAKLLARSPITSIFERTLVARGRWDNSEVWYRSQKGHWFRWLSEYDAPGYYGRQNSRRSAEFSLGLDQPLSKPLQAVITGREAR